MDDSPFVRRQFLALATALAARAALGAEPTPQNRDKTVCVLGASGRVGNLIVQQLLAAGFGVLAVSRSAEKLKQIAARHAGSERVKTLQGDVSSDVVAAQLRQRLNQEVGTPHAIVASLSSAAIDGPMQILASSTDDLRKAFETNFFTHVIAARALIPALASNGAYVGINGGLADFPAAGMAQLTTTQSAIRALYQVLALEAQGPKRPADHRPAVRVLELFGLVDDGQSPPAAQAMRIDGSALGKRVADIVANPSQFPGPVLALRSKAFS